MNKINQMLTYDVSFDVFNSSRVLANHEEISHSILHYRAREQRSLKQKIKSQQCLISWEENALIKFLLQMLDFEQFVRIKFISSLTFNITHQRFLWDKSHKSSNKNWAKILKKRHSILQARRIKSLNWNRHEKNTDNKITY